MIRNNKRNELTILERSQIDRTDQPNSLREQSVMIAQSLIPVEGEQSIQSLNRFIQFITTIKY